MLKKYIFLVIFLSFLSFVLPVFATVTCTTQYGGGQTCVSTGQLLVNKKVFNPENSQMVDNLTVNDHQFKMGDEVIFSIDVKNVGDFTLNNVTFSDTLPSFLTWISGDLNSTINSLTPGQIRTFTVKAKVNSNGTGCAVNTAYAAANGISDQDTSQVCIKGTVPAQIPQTGPEFLFLLLPLGGAGFFLRRHSGARRAIESSFFDGNIKNLNLRGVKK
mgnify:FL=1